MTTLVKIITNVIGFASKFVYRRLISLTYSKKFTWLIGRYRYVRHTRRMSGFCLCSVYRRPHETIVVMKFKERYDLRVNEPISKLSVLIATALHFSKYEFAGKGH